MDPAPRLSLRTLLAVLLCWLAPSLAGADEFAARYDAEIGPLIKRYCGDCHNAEQKDGEIDLTQFSSGQQAVAATLWPAVVRRLTLREMPPEGAPFPTDPEREKLFQWMQGLLARDDGNCDKLATDLTQHFYRGSVMSRRLTRAEYNHTLRDLLGLDLQPARDFPTDGAGGEGFDTTGDSLFINPILLEQYLAAADQVLETALPESTLNLAEDVAAARSRLLPAVPGEKLSAREAAEQNLRALIRRAYRRPVQDEDLARPLELFDRALERGDSFVAALRLAYKSVLISPNFLFLVEPEPAEEGVYPLGAYPLASRLSYLLWASMPDEELLALASSGELTKPEVLRGQVRRMLADERARGLAETFAPQWLGLDMLGTTIRPDESRFPEFNDELAQAMSAEATALVSMIFREDRSLLEFLDADYQMLNFRMAAHYGVPDVTGDEFRRVPTTDRNRGGLLGLAAVHVTTSYPLRTSPVLRGKWVLTEVLGERVPPPPPDVPALPNDDAPQDGLTMRQRFELHRQDAKCASCHQRLDPMGFGLENFDVLGRWRTEIGGQPVDASGVTPAGETFSGAAELKQVLLNRKQDFLQNLTRKMLGYALGRELNRFDDCVVRDTLKALEANDYRSSVLFEQIVLSFPFRHRYAKK